MFKKIIISIFLAFIAFVIGRVGHIYGGQLKTPHHWIYGAICMIVGAVYYKKSWSAYVFFFGLGMLVSDYTDFTQLKTFQPDPPGIKRFWAID